MRHSELIVKGPALLLIALSLLFSYFGFASSFRFTSLRASTTSTTSTSTSPRPAMPSSSKISSTSADLDLDLPAIVDLSPDQLSSNERYAEILNMTIQDVEKQKYKRQKASEDLHLTLQSLELNGKEKHELICQHLLDNGRHPFECSKCWTYKPICVCDLAATKNKEVNKGRTIAATTIAATTASATASATATATATATAAIPHDIDVDVIVWTHHREWGIISNTGIILSLTLPNLSNNCKSCQLLMKGLPQHDQILQDVILQSEQPDDPNRPLVVVLWPEVSKTKKESKKKKKKGDADADDHDSLQEQSSSSQSQSQLKPTYTSIDEIKKEMIKNKQRKMVLIAVDGTWRNARRMVSRLPLTIPRLDLSIDAVFDCNSNNDDDDQFTSILAPLRSRGDDERNNNGSTSSSSSRRQVCTAEAVVGALMNLGTITEHQGQHVLDVTKTKIERVCKYRGKDYNI